MTLPIDRTAAALRGRLGIPDDAGQVLILTESSHWDPNWLLTSEVYFDRFVRNNLDLAIAALQAEPRRIYGIECVFFLRMYWDRCPEQREAVRDLVNTGQLRLTHSAVTTADTLLPSTEALLRDILVGQEWLRGNGMTPEPTLAYFTDSFGASPMLPSVLQAAGFTSTAITRVDGMAGMGSDIELGSHFPRPGTSAELLLEREKSIDFVWRDGNGAEALTHWNAFTYGQGDMLAHRGISRMYLIGLALSDRSDRHVARRIGQFAAKLAPVSRTPYMLCPMGYDFIEPLPDLVGLLDRYNSNHYAETGIWAVNAGYDDYMALIAPYRDTLPVVELDPNPYWTGFYAARPVLKDQCHRLVDGLLLAEELALSQRDQAAARDVTDELVEAWWAAVTANHHDFITGTSPDEVVEDEQLPWLREALDTTDAVVVRLTDRLTGPAAEETTETDRSPHGALAWQVDDGRLTVETPHYIAVLDEAAGGAIVHLQAAADEGPLLTSPANDLVTYRDGGGLWRMGYEFKGGKWQRRERASDGASRLEVMDEDGILQVTCRTASGGTTLVRHVWFDPDSPVIRCQAEGLAPEGYSIAVRFPTGLRPETLVMNAPGGVLARPCTRYYEPTFWPLHQFAHLQDRASDRGLTVLQRLPGAISLGQDGGVELMAFRNAPHETAYGLIGLPATPAHGHETEPYTFDYALVPTDGNDRAAEDAALLWAQLTTGGPWDAAEPHVRRPVTDLVTTDIPSVRVTAVKPASRGEGVIVRLVSPLGPETPVHVRSDRLPIARATLCDARERDLAPLEVTDGAVRVPMAGTIATVRLQG